ncbi:MAG TPA: hypothetical protein VGB71_11905 [Flavisolibacter sp.]|jgi:hypothetical protein
MKKFALLAVVVLCVNLTFAQDEENEGGFKKEKLFAGGSFGLAFGRYTLVNLSPQIGYRFNRYFSSGLGLNLVFASQKQEDVYGDDLSKTTQWITGLSLFTRFYPSQKFLIQVQPEANYIFGNIKYYQPTETRFKINAEIIPSLLVGGGLVMPSDKGEFVTILLYDVLQRAGSPYGNRPVINVGYNFRF